MKINIEFNSWDELCKFLACANADRMPEDIVAEEPAKVEEPKKAEKKKTEKKEEAPAKVEKKAEPEKEAVDEELLPKVRKALSAVNKRTGKNTAKEWIKELGYDSLSGVSDPEHLKSLLAKAQEAL